MVIVENNLLNFASTYHKTDLIFFRVISLENVQQ